MSAIFNIFSAKRRDERHCGNVSNIIHWKYQTQITVSGQCAHRQMRSWNWIIFRFERHCIYETIIGVWSGATELLLFRENQVIYWSSEQCQGYYTFCFCILFCQRFSACAWESKYCIFNFSYENAPVEFTRKMGQCIDWRCRPHNRIYSIVILSSLDHAV